MAAGRAAVHEMGQRVIDTLFTELCVEMVSYQARQAQGATGAATDCADCAEGKKA